MNILKLAVIIVITQLFYSCGSSRSKIYQEYKPSKELISKKENVIFEKVWNRWDRRTNHFSYMVDRKEFIPKHSLSALLLDDPSPEVLIEIKKTKSLEKWKRATLISSIGFLITALVGTINDQDGNAKFSTGTNIALWSLYGLTTGAAGILINKQESYVEEAARIHNNRIRREKGIRIQVGTTF